MKIKGSKVAGGSWTTLGLPLIFLLCLFFFLAGFFGASLFSQQVRQPFYFYSILDYLYFCFTITVGVCVSRVDNHLVNVCGRQESPTSNLRPRTRELVEEMIELKGLLHGDSGEDSVETIPFQVCISAGLWILIPFQLWIVKQLNNLMYRGI